MIHIFIGTKAQFIKTAPVIRELQERNVPCNLIDSGQHSGLSRKLIEIFNLPTPQVFMRKEKEDIVSIKEAAGWFLKWSFTALFCPAQIRRKLFLDQGGVCLIHGDTLSTLLALFLAKRAGLKVVHIEAGLRSFNIFHPFPEELIRLITMRRADILFAPSVWAYNNLVDMKLKGEIINAGENTIADSIRYALTCKSDVSLPDEPYALVTTHRLETLYSRDRLERLINVLEKAAKKYKVLFIMHKPTKIQLQKFSLLERLENNPQIKLMPMQDYFDFLKLLQGCAFVITDGGSIQEECYYLNVPCLIMRKKTERQEGLGENAVLSEFDERKIDDFLDNFDQFRRKKGKENSYPSKLIVDYLLKLNKQGKTTPHLNPLP